MCCIKILITRWFLLPIMKDPINWMLLCSDLQWIIFFQLYFWSWDHFWSQSKKWLTSFWYLSCQLWTDFTLILQQIFWCFHYYLEQVKIGLGILTLSWRGRLSYRNQSIDLQGKSVDWFLYDNGLRHERVNPLHLRAKLQLFIIYSFWVIVRNSHQRCSLKKVLQLYYKGNSGTGVFLQILRNF